MLIPIFNDWESLAQLLAGLDEALTAHSIEADVLVIDDGSTIEGSQPQVCENLR